MSVAIVIDLITDLDGSQTALSAGIQHAFVGLSIAVVVDAVANFLSGKNLPHAFVKPLLAASLQTA